MMKNFLLFIGVCAVVSFSAMAQGKFPPVTVVMPAAAPARVKFGVDRLAAALKEVGYRVSVRAKGEGNAGFRVVVSDRGVSSAREGVVSGHGVGEAGRRGVADGRVASADSQVTLAAGDPGISGAMVKEGFSIRSSGKTVRVDGIDASGALYGCLELADRILSAGRLPSGLQVKDQPEMVLRGSCIGMQKPALLPGRGPYEYPYTPENFPWFYDRALWIKYLDSMVNNRLNTLYLWNGHPFASLVRLAEYPYAVEVDDATFKKNEEMFRFLTTEADRRGIWVIQLFYNIIVSKPFAEKNHLKTQDRSRPIIPLIADYTRKSIAAFVQKYPNVGLMITLGEAMEGVGQDDIDWFTKTIIPGIKDGLKALGRTEEPPVVLRAHDTDGPAVMKVALPLYKNLYVEAKYNGEALTTYTPHGSWADLHRQLSSISKGLIENVHIMANLEPFRYGSADFIQKCVQAMHSVYGAKGLHLYPQASYWDWPYTADKTAPRLLEMDRDWIWYKEWARYAWNCHRNREEEIKYWSQQLAAHYGCDEIHGKAILDAYEKTGEIAPKLLRRFGITDGNRQTLTLGMLMTQLIDPERYGLFTLLYESEGPPGELLSQYAEKEWKGLPHMGETPAQVCEDVVGDGQSAVSAIDQAAFAVTKNRTEFDRLRNDIYCWHLLADCYAAKARAALSILRYKYSNEVQDLENAAISLKNSVGAFRELTGLAGPAYLYANSMQTQQRKIPVRGVDGRYKTWGELLPLYEQELAIFDRRLDSLRAERVSSGDGRSGVGHSGTGSSGAGHPGLDGSMAMQSAAGQDVTPFQEVAVQLVTKTDGAYTVDSGSRVYSDTSFQVRAVAAPLKGIKGIFLSARQQIQQGTQLQFTNTEPVDLLVGFFDQKGGHYLPAPQLETDASANDYGQAEPKITNALVITGLPSVNIHAWTFLPGNHTLTLGKGMCLVLGFVKAEKRKSYDAGVNEPGKKNLDWLFE